MIKSTNVVCQGEYSPQIQIWMTPIIVFVAGGGLLNFVIRYSIWYFSKHRATYAVSALIKLSDLLLSLLLLTMSVILYHNCIDSCLILIQSLYAKWLNCKISRLGRWDRDFVYYDSAYIRHMITFSRYFANGWCFNDVILLSRLDFGISLSRFCHSVKGI